MTGYAEQNRSVARDYWMAETGLGFVESSFAG